MALLVTQVATATAAFTWMVVEWLVAKKPTAVGIATGAVAGLVAITPASGSVGPVGATGHWSLQPVWRAISAATSYEEGSGL